MRIASRSWPAPAASAARFRSRTARFAPRPAICRSSSPPRSCGSGAGGRAAACARASLPGRLRRLGPPAHRSERGTCGLAGRGRRLALRAVLGLRVVDAAARRVALVAAARRALGCALRGPPLGTTSSARRAASLGPSLALGAAVVRTCLVDRPRRSGRTLVTSRRGLRRTSRAAAGRPRPDAAGLPTRFDPRSDRVGLRSSSSSRRLRRGAVVHG